MEYKKYEFPNFNLYTIKTNRFKTCQMQIIFSSEASKKEMLSKTFLADFLTECSNKYNSRKMIARELEDLYQANFYGLTNKSGNLMMTSFILSFINPRYTSMKDYLTRVLQLPFEMILNPSIEAGEFDIKIFNVIKNRLQDEILGTQENINQFSLKKALSYLDNSSPSSYGVLGTLEELEEISPKTLKNSYDKLLEDKCDIFIAGNLDMDEVANIIFKCFKLNVIQGDFVKDLYVVNKPNNNVKKIQEKGSFLETNLLNLYSLDNLTAKEKIVSFNFYNYLLGGGGLNTKLYQLLREKNSLCYGIRSMYLKYDNLLLIQTSIDKKNVKKAQRLINLALKEMIEGKFSEAEINYAKESFVFSLNLALDNLNGILNNYIFHVFDNLPLIEDRIKAIKAITKDDIVKVARKIKPNIQFVLEGVENNGDN